ncbi:hypothetical protein [Falsiroseomonas sp. HW251]|uniref:hypothetical protein n=1 Tax=Falsiroseomonas sp. HW251 TaxID=3390998 RepID=UPI003D312918
MRADLDREGRLYVPGDLLEDGFEPGRQHAAVGAAGLAQPRAVQQALESSICFA